MTALEMLVRQKKALCPISVDTFAEVFKQSDPATLSATVQLIDDLSMGVSILEFGKRLQLEAFHFICEKTKGPEAIHPLDDLAWTKTAYVLGFKTPTNRNLPPETDAALQKAFFDQMWAFTLSDMLDQLGPNAAKMGKAWFSEDFANQLNSGKFSHTHEYASFDALFLNELAGHLDVHKTMFEDLMQHIWELDKGKGAAPSETEKVNAGRLMSNLIYNAFRFHKIKAELPSMRIGAGLHAAIRWDRHRKYKLNDFHDIHHAVAALPYCDIFLTEHSLRHLVSDKNLRFSSFFKCKTVSDASEALSVVGDAAA